MQADIRDVKIERYFPDVLANSKEFKELAKIVDPELVGIWKALWKQMLNTFVYDLDIDGAVRWESMLQLHPKITDSLDMRKRAILAKINATLPYTFRSFQAMLDSIYGKDRVIESVVLEKQELWLDTAAELIGRTAEIRRLAAVISPANMGIFISNTKICSVNQYYGCIIGYCGYTIIEASVACNLNVGIEMPARTVGIIKTYKHIVIGG